MSAPSDKSGEFVVRMSELPTSRRIALTVPFIEEAIGTLPIRAALERAVGDARIGSGQAAIDLYEGSPGVFVRGTLAGTLEVGCSRCVEAVIIAIDETIAVSYLPASEVEDDKTDEDEFDEQAAEDDEDLYPYEGESIDLSRLFTERLILAVPFAPLCKDDCKGLCSVCGSNLNESECGCDRHVADPRFAALANLKLSPES